MNHYDQNYMVKPSHNLPLVLGNYSALWTIWCLKTPINLLSHPTPQTFLGNPNLKGRSILVQAWIALIKFIMKKSVTQIND